jgi:hypothetical protein
MTALIFTILAGAFAIGAFVCAMTDKHVDSTPPMSRRREKARMRPAIRDEASE